MDSQLLSVVVNSSTNNLGILLDYHDGTFTQQETYVRGKKAGLHESVHHWYFTVLQITFEAT